MLFAESEFLTWPNVVGAFVVAIFGSNGMVFALLQWLEKKRKDDREATDKRQDDADKRHHDSDATRASEIASVLNSREKATEAVFREWKNVTVSLREEIDKLKEDYTAKCKEAMDQQIRANIAEQKLEDALRGKDVH